MNGSYVEPLLDQDRDVLDMGYWEPRSGPVAVYPSSVSSDQSYDRAEQTTLQIVSKMADQPYFKIQPVNSIIYSRRISKSNSL